MATVVPVAFLCMVKIENPIYEPFLFARSLSSDWRQSQLHLYIRPSIETDYVSLALMDICFLLNVINLSAS